ncbi:MAG: dihydroneopterin aldolase [Hyphomicrobiales bacterium]|nr:dihydroneopterin aldolase [Hyphomicrobiales bacterium]
MADDAIRLINMPFYAHHGVHPEEAKLGQRFYLDLVCRLDLSKPGHTDNYADAVCYEQLYRTVEGVVTGHRYHLLEALGETIAARLLERFPDLLAVEVAIRKPNAPIVGFMDHVEVVIRRSRHG